MLRKRTRSHQKDHQLMGHLIMSDSGSESDTQKRNSFSVVPGLFIGLGPKGLSDCDSVRSPTSPLDFKVFSNPNKFPGSPLNGNQRSWGDSKVGLSIVDSLDDDAKGPGKVLRPSESKNIIFGPQVRNKTPTFQHTYSFEAPKSLPKNFAISRGTSFKSPLQKGSSDVLFEIGDSSFEAEPFGKTRSCSLNSCKSYSGLSCVADMNSKVSSGNNFLHNVPSQMSSSFQCLGGSNTFTPLSVSSGNGFVGGLSASDIELSEEYTCVISHGPNPRKTHIFGDCILECSFDDSNIVIGKNGGDDIIKKSAPSPFFPNDFLSFCDYCHKKLEQGKDIYIYRGEKAFCSLICRSQEIMIDEEMDETINASPDEPPKANSDEDLFNSGLFSA